MIVFIFCIFSTVKRIEQGFKDASDGKVERSIENFLPPGIANIYKTAIPTPVSGRLAREGYETRRGDPIFDDVTGGDLAGILFVIFILIPNYLPNTSFNFRFFFIWISFKTLDNIIFANQSL